MVALSSNSQVEYDPVTGRYLIDGRPVTAREIEAVLEQESRENERKLLALLLLLVESRITLQEFQERVIGIVEPSTIRAMVLGAGGDQAFRRNSQNREYLRQLRKQNEGLATGLASIGFAMRAGQRTAGQVSNYLKRAARHPFQAHNESQTLTRLGGLPNEARRRLDPTADHCPSCPGYETDGFVPIEDIVPIGFACECGGRCRCNIVYRFNPLRALNNLGSGATLEDQVRARSENLDRVQADYLQRLEDRKRNR